MPTAMRKRLLATLLLTLPGRPEAAPVDLTYTVYAAGLRIMEVTARLDLGDDRYRIEATTRTVGAAALFARSTQVTMVEGGWRGPEPVPRRYRADGTLRGEPRHVHIDFDGRRPLLRRVEPPNEVEREAVPEAMLPGSVDALSALARMMRLAGMEGSCDARASTFDGRRLQAWRSRTEGVERLTVRSIRFDGTVLRCGFEGRVVAGFRNGDPRGDAARPFGGTAWLGTVSPFLPPVPVRLEFDTRWFGTARAELEGVATPPVTAP
ncbi:DUF3108 domain-containing protein [Roseomonas hellenica]|uniref:DUF3108 domain-containing protein n=1 Tax=Plastoroseomonas hellenica TaxID=2687306 RepID=A0ABS5EWE2_9PROT|nr:DUF3108 domain-containing protein [Plastoroseomonas hellenica]MBR0664260.1 DUF3108 domain-containing protein [Plastoroseomonas hellenica]